jgi:hypothetical protein
MFLSPGSCPKHKNKMPRGVSPRNETHKMKVMRVPTHLGAWHFSVPHNYSSFSKVASPVVVGRLTNN